LSISGRSRASTTPRATPSACSTCTPNTFSRSAVRLLQLLTVNDIGRVPSGGAIYTSLCDENGGMIDDLLIYRLAEDRFRMAPTPSRFLVVLDWIQAHSGE